MAAATASHSRALVLSETIWCGVFRSVLDSCRLLIGRGEGREGGGGM